ncbi:MAG: Hpt domain-containing protein, partial [Bacteroidia bacterium]
MTPQLVTRIGVGIQGEDWVEVHSAVHKMKPSVDMMGVKSLYDVVRKIEYNAKNESDLDQIPRLYDILSDTLSEVYQQLRDR